MDAAGGRGREWPPFAPPKRGPVTAAPWFAALLIAVTLVAVAVGRDPWLRMNRATIALAGAVAPVAGIGWLTWGS